jgi:UrcA family protein
MLAVAALATLAVAGQAAAAPSERDASAAFLSTAKVDFQDPAQVQAFYARLERVAREVCDSRISDRSVQREDAACAREAARDAVTRLSRPLLTAAYQAKSGTAFATGF